MFLKYLQIVNYKNLRSARFSFVEGVNTVIGEMIRENLMQ